jgi:SAM-dependent methyltransferase
VSRGFEDRAADWIRFARAEGHDAYWAYRGSMPAAVAEAGRVLRPGGCFCACVPHPFSEAGEFEGSADDAPLFVAGSYLLEADYELVSDREGIVFRFASRRSHSSHIRAHSNPAGSRSRRCASRHFRAPRAIDGPVCRCSSCGGP